MQRLMLIVGESEHLAVWLTLDSQARILSGVVYAALPPSVLWKTKEGNDEYIHSIHT